MRHPNKLIHGTQQFVVTEVEVLGILPRLEPHQRRGKVGKEKSGDCLTFFRRKWLAASSSHDQVEKIFFTLELIAEFSDCAAEFIWFQSNRLQGEQVAGTGKRWIERG